MTDSTKAANSKAKKFLVRKLSRHSLALREFITIVDAEDAHYLRSYVWMVIESSNVTGKKNNYIAKRGPNGNEFLHHIVSGAASGDLVLHINGNSLDNRKKNLFKPQDRVQEIE